MVKQTKQIIVREIDKLDDIEAAAVYNYISQLVSTRFSKTKESKINDDLIVSLADAYENQRARQVIEWERVRRQNAPRAA